MSPLYLYAVLGAGAAEGDPACGVGVAGEQVSLRIAGGLQVAAGALPAAPPEPCLEAMRAHDALVRRLAQRCRSILPLRFGQVVDGDEALEARIARFAPGLRRALELVEDCEQSTLRVFGSPHEHPPAPAAPTSEHDEELRLSSGGGPGTRHMTALLQRRTAVPAELEAILAAVSPLVRAQRIETASHEPLLASVYHLVPRRDRPAYDLALDGALADHPELRVRASGPWPPYAFVSGWPA